MYVEDDREFARDTKVLLEHCNFRVVIAKTVLEGHAEYFREKPDILLLDYQLKDGYGLELLKKIRKYDSEVAIVFYTNYNGEKIEKEILELKADDYIWKGENIGMVVVKLKNIYWRTHRHEEELHIIRLTSSTTFNYKTGKLQIKDQEEHLTPIISGLLRMLCEKQNEIVNSEEICRKLWNDSDKKDELHRYIPRLTKALKADTAVRLINIRGIGYLLKLENKENS